MAEMFTRDELAGIIACVDKEYSDLWQMYDRQGIDLTDTPIQRHLFSIMKKAAAMAKEMEKPRKVELSTLYGIQLNNWRTDDPDQDGKYKFIPLTVEEAQEIVSILGYIKPEFNNRQKEEEIDRIIYRIIAIFGLEDEHAD